MGFKPSKTDPCLFLRTDIICVIYVDDTIFFAKSKTTIENVIIQLKKSFELTDEGEVDAFLGIKLTKTLNQTLVFDDFLKGCAIDKNGHLVRNKIFSGTGPAQPFLDYALWNLIGYVPDNAKIDKSLKCANIKRLDLPPTRKRSKSQ